MGGEVTAGGKKRVLFRKDTPSNMPPRSPQADNWLREVNVTHRTYAVSIVPVALKDEYVTYFRQSIYDYRIASEHTFSDLEGLRRQICGYAREANLDRTEIPGSAKQVQGDPHVYSTRSTLVRFREIMTKRNSSWSFFGRKERAPTESRWTMPQWFDSIWETVTGDLFPYQRAITIELQPVPMPTSMHWTRWEGGEGEEGTGRQHHGGHHGGQHHGEHHGGEHEITTTLDFHTPIRRRKQSH